MRTCDFCQHSGEDVGPSVDEVAELSALAGPELSLTYREQLEQGRDILRASDGTGACLNSDHCLIRWRAAHPAPAREPYTAELSAADWYDDLVALAASVYPQPPQLPPAAGYPVVGPQVPASLLKPLVRPVLLPLPLTSLAGPFRGRSWLEGPADIWVFEHPVN